MRSWVTGIQRVDIENRNFKRYAGAIYFSMVSAVVFFAAVILIPVALFKRKLSWQSSGTIIILLIYYGLIHLPFAIQARYTIPLRLALLLILARTIACLFLNNKVAGAK